MNHFKKILVVAAVAFAMFVGTPLPSFAAGGPTFEPRATTYPLNPIDPYTSKLTYQSVHIHETLDIPAGSSVDVEVLYAKSIADLNDPAKRKSASALQGNYQDFTRETADVDIFSLVYDTKYYFRFHDKLSGASGSNYFFQTKKLPTITFNTPYAILGATNDQQTVSDDISFVGDVPGTTAIIQYGKDGGTLSQSVPIWTSEDKQDGMTYTFHKTLSGLDSGTKYNFQIFLTYPTGRSVKSTVEHFTTPDASSGGSSTTGGGTTDPNSQAQPTRVLDFTGTPTISCSDTDQVCSFSVTVQGLVNTTVDESLDMYPQSEVTKNPGDPTKWQKGTTLAPVYPVGAQLAPGTTYTLTSSASYAQLKNLPNSSGTTDTIYYPIISYRVTGGGASGLPQSASSGQGTKALNESKLATSGAAATVTAPVQPPTGSSLNPGNPGNPTGSGNPGSTATGPAACGLAGDGRSFSSKPTNALCNPGTASTVADNVPSGWKWSCTSTTPANTANCTATQSSAAPSGSDPITATGTGSVNLGGQPGTGSSTAPGSGSASDPGTSSNIPSNYLQNPFKNLDTFPKIIKAVVNNIVLPIAVPFVAVMLIYSGFLFIVARKEGKPGSLDKAKDTLKYTLIGAALVLGAFVIANALQGTLNSIIS